MDAYEIARLFTAQGDEGLSRIRFGTVESIDRDTLTVIPDGESLPVPVIRCCHPATGSRVVLVVSGTAWLAVSVIGGDSQCPTQLGDVWITFSSDDPHDRWPGTTWEQLHDRMLLASGKSSVGETGGEEEHTLTKAEMPSHAHALIGYWRVPNSGGDNLVASYRGISSDQPTTEEDSSVRYNGGSQPHNNMPPYTTVHMWRRIA